MRIITVISELIIPIVFSYIIFYGYFKKIDIYGTFVDGAKKGLKISIKLLPTLIGLMAAVGIMRASGFFEIITELVTPITDIVSFPSEVVTLTFMRLVSSSASTGILLDLFKNYGPDSFTGRFVSVMMSCTETVFYTMSIYFMSVKITKTRYTLAGALVANVAGIAASLWICRVLWQ